MCLWKMLASLFCIYFTLGIHLCRPIYSMFGFLIFIYAMLGSLFCTYSMLASLFCIYSMLVSSSISSTCQVSSASSCLKVFFYLVSATVARKIKAVMFMNSPQWILTLILSDSLYTFRCWSSIPTTIWCSSFKVSPITLYNNDIYN